MARPKADPNETPQEKARKTANRRAQQFADSCRKVANLNSSAYDLSDEERGKIVGFVQTTAQELIATLKSGKVAKPTLDIFA